MQKNQPKQKIIPRDVLWPYHMFTMDSGVVLTLKSQHEKNCPVNTSKRTLSQLSLENLPYKYLSNTFLRNS